MQGSVGAGYPPFELWRLSELPVEWQRGPSQDALARAAIALRIPVEDLVYYTAIEIPDNSVGRLYHSWAVDQLGRAGADDDLVPVMLVSQDNFRGTSGDEAMCSAVEFVFSLLECGKPPAYFSTVYESRAR